MRYVQGRITMRYVLCVIAVLAMAAASGPQTARAQQAADLEAVRQANETFLETVGAHDLAGMESLWRHEPYVRAIHPFRPIDEGWDAVRDGWMELFEMFPEMSSVMATPHIRVVGDVAWVTGEEAFEGVPPSGDPVAATLRTTRIFERTDSGWRLVLHQVSPPPHE
jgi:ketosteroid isomerase-like protein